MAASAPGPLARTLDRLGALEPWFRGELGRPAGGGWYRLDDLAPDGRIPAWVDELSSRNGGRRDVAASYLGGWLAGAATIVSTTALVLERRLPDPSGPLWVHRGPGGWFDRCAFERPDLLVEPGDVAVGHAEVTVVEHDELVERFACGLAARSAPIVEAIRAVAPLGRAGLWGAVADEVAGAALWVARAAGTDADAGWSTAAAVTERLGAHIPWLTARPRRFEVHPASGPPCSFIVRATCCLYYKTQPQPPDPAGDSYCTTCPSRDDASRTVRLLDHLDGASS